MVSLSLKPKWSRSRDATTQALVVVRGGGLVLSFCGYLALNMYLEFRVPETVGILPVFSKGRMVLLEVSPGSPGAGAGLKAGDRVLTVEGQAIHSRCDWIARMKFTQPHLTIKPTKLAAP